MNYLNRKNAQYTYLAMVNGVRKEVPSLMHPYINTIRLVGTKYLYDPNTKEYTMTINYLPYGRSFIDLLVTLASIKQDYKIITMYEKKYQNNSLYDNREIKELIATRVDDFDFNNPVFKKLILASKTMCHDFHSFSYVNDLIKYITNKYSNEIPHNTLLDMIYQGFITKEDIEQLSTINPSLANFYLMNYDFIKRYNLSLVRKI